MSNKNIYLLLGPEKGKKKDFLKTLFTKISKTTGEKPEVFKFYPFEDDIEKILTEIQSSSLFASSKIILINEADTINATDAKILGTNIPETTPDTFIVFMSDQTSAAKISKSIEKLVVKENKIIFWELFESDKRSWIIGFFKKQQQTINNEAIDLILELVENNTEDIKSNCQNLSLFYAKETTIDNKMVEEFLYHSKEENAFSLFERLVEKDTIVSLEILDKIISSGNTHFILLCGGLLFQFRRLHQLVIEMRNSIPDQTSMKKMGIIAQKQQKTYKTACSNFKIKDVEKIINDIHNFEIIVRTNPQDIHNTAAQLLIFSITEKKPFILHDFNQLY
ncbi:MAG: DNA polymerase III subunit delta [Spirochaetales bacterium]|nr:DNA polymerase III subunit delta [Spirochaetales bacterium]